VELLRLAEDFPRGMEELLRRIVAFPRGTVEFLRGAEELSGEAEEGQFLI
jgi:hypothetical protein